MGNDEMGANVQQVGGGKRAGEVRRTTETTKKSAWVLTAWMVLAPLLMLVTVWLLVVFRRGQ